MAKSLNTAIATFAKDPLIFRPLDGCVRHLDKAVIRVVDNSPSAFLQLDVDTLFAAQWMGVYGSHGCKPNSHASRLWTRTNEIHMLQCPKAAASSALHQVNAHSATLAECIYHYTCHDAFCGGVA